MLKADRFCEACLRRGRYLSLRTIGTIEGRYLLGSERELVDGAHPAALFETRIIHLGDTRPACIG